MQKYGSTCSMLPTAIIELEGACGRELTCSTCHLVFHEEVYAALPQMNDKEEDMLDLAFRLTET